MARLYRRAMKRTNTLTQRTMQVRKWINTGEARRLRVILGISQAAAARDCEVDATAISRWENAERMPRGRNVSAYYRFLARLEAAQQHSGGDVA